MRRITLTILILLTLLLAGCNLPTQSMQTPTPAEADAVATQVSQLLTANPTFTVEQPSATPAPSQTPEPAASPTPQAEATGAPAPTATLISGDPRSSLGEPTWRDNLDTSDSFSYLYENEGTRVSHEPGALVLTGRTPNGWLGWTLTFKQQPQNFYLEGTFNTGACSGGDMYGLVFRAPDADGGYYAGFTCDGRYNLHARDFTDGSDKQIIALTSHSAIQTGPTTNRIGIMVNGDKIGLYANGTLLQEVTDTTFTEKGYYGPLVAGNATTDFTVRLDEILLWTLP
jgi:hypothetical protein